jgi:hypothetical protein
LAARNHDHRNVWSFVLQHSRHLAALQAWHFVVDNHTVKGLGAEKFECAISAIGYSNLVAVASEQNPVKFAYSSVIVDAQQFGTGHGGGPAVFKFLFCYKLFTTIPKFYVPEQPNYQTSTCVRPLFDATLGRDCEYLLPAAVNRFPVGASGW